MQALVRIVSCLALAAAVLFSQRAYDANVQKRGDVPEIPAAALVQAFDLGLHTAAASFFWLDVRTELPFLRRGPQRFLDGLALVNDLDPRWSTPYAFTVLVLPNVPRYENRIAVALATGKKGLANADPDWRIPFYMGAIYQLELQDHLNAARHFDLAAATPGVPEPVRRFSINYGIHPGSLDITRQAWEVIYATAPDATVRQRAAAHITHLEVLEELNRAVQEFHAKTGRYPASFEEILQAGILKELPQSPFGIQFQINEKGIVGVAPEA